MMPQFITEIITHYIEIRERSIAVPAELPYLSSRAISLVWAQVMSARQWLRAVSQHLLLASGINFTLSQSPY